MQTELNALSLTRDLLSFNTINPPGQERECAHFLGNLLENGGFKVVYHEFDKGRTSLVDVGSVTTDPENEWIQTVFDTMETFLGERPVPRGVSYFTDASILTPAFDNPPTVILGPGEPAMAHKTDEFCHITKIEQAAEAYYESPIKHI